MFNPSMATSYPQLQMIQPCPMAPTVTTAATAYGYPSAMQRYPQQQRIAPRSPAPIIVPSSHHPAAAYYPTPEQQAYGPSPQLCIHCRARTVKPTRVQRDGGLCKHCKKDLASPTYYPTGYYRQQQQPPIHHTLQNATITYDSLVNSAQQQRDLVKDVFFSPALSSTFDATAAAAAAAAAAMQSESSQASDSDSDTSIATPLDCLSPRLSPADFLLGGDQEEALFGFEIEDALKDSSTTENVGLGITLISKKKPTFSLANDEAFVNNKKRTFLHRLSAVGDLPTPPASSDFSYDNFVDSPKRRKLDSTGHHTPPASPSEDQIAHDDYNLFQDSSLEEDDECFEGDASAEESDDDEHASTL
jgi:ribosomal protein L37AE/L43A